MDKWYYVFRGERKGPVDHQNVQDLYSEGTLLPTDYVWKKGFDNWLKIQDVNEFSKEENRPQLTSIPGPPEVDQSMPEPIPEKVTYQRPSFKNVDSSSKVYFIKTGADRGGKGAEYGPFSIDILKKLYAENRMNSKTFVFTKGIETWTPLGSFEGFQQVFNEVPDPIEEVDKRAFKRKPLIARMFIENNNQLFEGICRDVSIGGMQVLVDKFPGSGGERISINVHPENTEHHFTASGEIVRVLDGGLGFSFRFINLSDEAIKAINSYISGE